MGGRFLVSRRSLDSNSNLFLIFPRFSSPHVTVNFAGEAFYLSTKFSSGTIYQPFLALCAREPASRTSVELQFPGQGTERRSRPRGTKKGFLARYKNKKEIPTRDIYTCTTTRLHLSSLHFALCEFFIGIRDIESLSKRKLFFSDDTVSASCNSSPRLYIGTGSSFIRR